jgi:hypothetical protein
MWRSLTRQGGVSSKTIVPVVVKLHGIAAPQWQIP